MSGIVINIKRRPRRSGMNAGDQNGGIIRGPRRKRMLPKKRRVGGINFYDLGQIRDGENWVDLPFSRSVSDGTLTATRIPLDDTFYDDLKSLIFTVDMSDWRDYYRKLTYEEAERYGIDFAVGDQYLAVARPGSRRKIISNEMITENNWTPSGFQFDSMPSEWVLMSRGLSSFIGTTSDFKITAVDNFEAPEVPFALRPNADIFLMPAIGGESNYGYDDVAGILLLYTTADPPMEWRALLSCRILSREMFLFRNDSAAAGGYPNNDYMTFASGFAFYDDEPNKIAALDYFIDVGEEAIIMDGPPNTPISMEELFNSVPRQGYYRVRTARPGMLCGVIMQDSSVYYVWRITDDLSYDGNPQVSCTFYEI